MTANCKSHSIQCSSTQLYRTNLWVQGRYQRDVPNPRLCDTARQVAIGQSIGQPGTVARGMMRLDATRRQQPPSAVG
jgi:hypothetical protein